jgi:hypothetical protein
MPPDDIFMGNGGLLNLKPWEKARGATTPEGKARSSKNAHRFTYRKCSIFASWLLKQSNHLQAGRACASREMVARMFEDCHCFALPLNEDGEILL